MEVEPKLRDLKYCLLREMVVYKEHQGTCSAVIYGLNAVGKSALAYALRDFRTIVMRGSIAIKDDGHDLALIPTSFDAMPKPTTFEVSLTKGGTLYQYVLAVDIGRFRRPDDSTCYLDAFARR